MIMKARRMIKEGVNEIYKIEITDKEIKNNDKQQRVSR